MYIQAEEKARIKLEMYNFSDYSLYKSPFSVMCVG